MSYELNSLSLIIVVLPIVIVTFVISWVTTRMLWAEPPQQQALTTLNNASVEAMLHKRNREFNLLYEAGKDLGQSLDLITIYRTVYRVVSTSMPCNTLIVSTFDNDSSLIRCAYVNYEGDEHDVSGFPPIRLEAEGKGPQSDAIHSGESLLINDYQARIRQTAGKYYVDKEGEVHEDNPDDDNDDEITRSALIIPMKLDNQVHGVLQIQSHLLNAYTRDHLCLLDALAPQVAAAGNNAILYAQAQREIAERIRAQEAEKEQRIFAEALRDTAVTLNSSFDLEEIFDRLLQNVGRVIPYDGINILLFEANKAYVVRYQGPYTQSASHLELAEEAVPIEQIHNFFQLATIKKSILIPNTESDPNWQTRPHTEWIKSYLGAPIIIGDKVIGSLNVDAAQSNFFTEEQVEQLQVFANYTAVAIQHSRLYQELAAQNELLESAVIARTAELQHAMEQVNAILTNSPDAILLLNIDGHIMTHNPASCAMFGWSKTSLPHQLQDCLATAAHRRKFTRNLQEVLREEMSKRFDSVGKRLDGSTFDMQIALAPIRRNGVIVKIICSLHDISTLKEIERMKDAFVSNVSHELRTPITSLRLHHDLIQRSPEKTSIYISRINREIDRLNILIEDLLHLSRLDQDRVSIELHPLDLGKLVFQYATDRQILVKINGLTIDYELMNPLPLVFGDEGLIGQALSILLTNAINYTPQNGRISIATVAQEKDNIPWVGIQVRDTGLGIPIEEQAHIFQRFYRGQIGQTSGAPGTGLGLSIAQEIVSRHHGTIEVVSDGIPGKGSCFTIWLPAASETDLLSPGIKPRMMKNGVNAGG